MSFDFQIGNEDFNYTYNVSPMFYACYPEHGIRIIDGFIGKRAEFNLNVLREYMIEHARELEAMNPTNGWGDYIGALQLVNNLLHASQRHPIKIWSIT